MKLLSTVLSGLAILSMTSTATCKSAQMTNSFKLVDEQRLVYAIGRAENSKIHPYGVLKRFKHTTPRQACLNTISHQRTLWEAAGRPSDFITWLSRTYAPIGASNDPRGLNRFWTANVRYFYNHP